MIGQCRVCGVCAGGLASPLIPMESWPETDLCPCCPSLPDESVQAILEMARREVEPIIQRELDGERITTEVLHMILR